MLDFRENNGLFSTLPTIKKEENNKRKRSNAGFSYYSFYTYFQIITFYDIHVQRKLVITRSVGLGYFVCYKIFYYISSQ